MLREIPNMQFSVRHNFRYIEDPDLGAKYDISFPLKFEEISLETVFDVEKVEYERDSADGDDFGDEYDIEALSFSRGLLKVNEPESKRA